MSFDYYINDKALALADEIVKTISILGLPTQHRVQSDKILKATLEVLLILERKGQL